MPKLGFTGTSKGMTNKQAAEVRHQLTKYMDGGVVRSQFHDGDCVGADSEAHDIASDLGYFLVGHPPSNDTARAYKHYNLTYATKPYLVRNRNIVDATQRLIAAPSQKTEQLRSGTWSTVRYARKLGRPITLVFPDGTTRHESNEA